MNCSKVIKETKNRECSQPRLGYLYVNTSKSRSENSCFSLSPTIIMKATQMKAFWWDRRHESHQLRCDGRRAPIISGSFTHFMIYISPPTDWETESKTPKRERRTTCPLRDAKQRDLPLTLKVIHNLFHCRIYIFQSLWVKCGRVI